MGSEFHHLRDGIFSVIESKYSSMSYYLDRDTGNYVLEWLNSSQPGWGKRTVREFRNTVGPNKSYESNTGEIETLRKLQELGYEELLINENTHTIVDPNVLLQLKIVRVIIGGMLTVEKLELMHDPEFVLQIAISGSFYGRTL